MSQEVINVEEADNLVQEPQEPTGTQDAATSPVALNSSAVPDASEPPTDAARSEAPQETEPTAEHQEPNASETQDKIGTSHEEVDNFEEVEEEYEEEVEENGEVKLTVKKRIVKVPKQAPPDDQVDKAEEEEIEEEYEEEELDDNGEVKIVIKKRLVKVPKPVTVLRSSESFVEKEEEYEEEEVNESGETVTVKKVRLIKVPKEIVIKESKESFEEVEEEYTEEEVNESGETVTVTKTRIVQVLKEKFKKSEETDKEEEEKKSITQKISEKSLDEKPTEDSKEVEELEEEGIEEEEVDEEEEEEEEIGEEEEVAEEMGVTVSEGEKKRGRRKKKVKTEKGDYEEDEDIEPEKRRKKRRRKKRTSTIEEKRISELSIDVSKEGVDEEKSRDGTEDVEEEEEKSDKVSVSSSQLRLAEEKAAIAEQYDILQKLRSEHLALKKKSFYLSSKLIQYLRKQKMDHILTDVKEDQDLEQRLIRKLLQYHECNQEANEEKMKITSDWEVQMAINEDLSRKVKEGWDNLTYRKREFAAKLIDAKTNRTIVNDKAIEDLISREENQVKQLQECRLLQVKLKRKIDAKKEERQMDHMGMDFNLMDYEKLVSLKEYYTDKITERNIEIEEVQQKMDALNDKASVTREQLRRKLDELKREQQRLRVISAQLVKKRMDLNKVKATKHKTEKNTAKIKQESGLLAYPALLKDFEEKTQQLQELQFQTESLKRTYRNNLKRMEKLKAGIKRRTTHKLSYLSTSSTLKL